MDSSHPHEPDAPLLVCRSLNKSFAATAAIRDLDLELAPGELVAILGASGCGKSTLLRLIAGLDRPDSGTISCKGVTWADNDTFLPAEKRDCGMVFQDLALFPHLSIGQNIAFALPWKGRRRKVAEMLALVGLDGMEKRMVHQLSGGQQQRVALARSLALQPGLLLLDEPFSSLDLKLRQVMRSEVRKILNSRGVAAILVTHDQTEAFAFASRVAVMEDGRIEQTAPPREVYLNPATRTIAAFVGEADFLPMERALLAFPRLNELAPALRDADNQLMCRPEELVLVSGDSATVVESEFQGAQQVVEIDLDCGGHLHLHADSSQQWSAGARVTPLLENGAVFSPDGRLRAKIPPQPA